VTPRPEPADRRAVKDRVADRTVLVVDDNETSRDLLTRHARAWGMTPRDASGGHAALELLRAAARAGQPYDVAVIDQHMPDLDGVTLAARIAGDPAIPPTNLVLLTSGTYADDRNAAAAGADAVLRKPVGPSQLYNCLVELLDPAAAEAARTARQQATAAVPAGDSHGRGRILLAEDNAINQMVAVDTLSMLGYDVDIARNGLEALRMAESHAYAAVLMDCQMPKMDGYTATSRLREHEDPGRHVPIIAMTAGALAEDRQRCLAAGMDDHLAKPIDPDQLQAALARWTGGSVQRHG
jgi:CheY-like chemotaxis protein